MSENLHLVFSKPPEAISDEEYNRWYDFHLGEILVVPGFVSARRYRLQTVKGDWTPSGHRSVFHNEAGDIEEASKFVDIDQLCLSPQCGFSSTLDGNSLSRDEQVAKLRLVVETAEEVWGAR